MIRSLLLVLPLICGACSTSPSAEVLRALAGDPNAICWTISTPWGSSSFDRNHGCGAASAPIVVVGGGAAQVLRP